MAEDRRPKPPETSRDKKTGDGSDLLGGLKALLEEEGAGLDLADNIAAGDDLADLFDGAAGDGDVAAGATPESGASKRHRSANGRQVRKQRDLDEFKGLGAHLRLSSVDLQVSEDRMTVRAGRITPAVSADDIAELLEREMITAGIDHEAIRIALVKANSGHNQFGVTVARGRQPRILKPSSVVYHFPPKLITDKSRAKAPFERLVAVLAGSSLEACRSWRGPVKFVRKGDLLAELVAAEIEPGFDVYGQELLPETRDGLKLEAGDNASVSEDGRRCTADLCGYAGVVAGVSVVAAPVWMSPDCMEAHFVFHPPPDEPPVLTDSDLREILEMKWIEFGILEKQLGLIVKRLADRQGLPVTVPVAQGVPAVSGEDPRIRYPFDPGKLMKWSQLDSVLSLKTPEAVEQAFVRIYDGGQESGTRFAAVGPAEVVAEKIPGTSGVAGMDIQGEEVTPEESGDTPLETGEGLSVSEDGLEATADHFGYVGLRWDTETTLISPIWIALDRTAAHFLNLPQGAKAKYPNLEQMQVLLDRAGIVNGYDPQRWSAILAALEAGENSDFLIPVAAGTPSRPAADAEFEWAVQTDSYAPGRILDDGSIDLRDRNLASVVKEGDLLGRLVPPKLGATGRDVFGDEIAPLPPRTIEVVTDAHVYAEPEEDGRMAFFSEVGGGLSTTSSNQKIGSRPHQRLNIGVNPVSTIEGDVDYHTGNIDFNGDVVIEGSVQSQFIVKATGTVTIGGYVEAGALVVAGKDLLVQRGVVGASTELMAGDDVMVKYIQEASVRAGRDLKVGSYIYNASVRAGGRITVPGKGEGESKALVGGLAWGARGISAGSLGSAYNSSTHLVVGVDPAQVNRAEQIRANMRACEARQRKLLKKIGVETVDLEIIKEKLAGCTSPSQRQAMLMAVKQIAKVSELRENQQLELSEIAVSQRRLARQTTIDVAREAFAGVELRIGERTELLRQDTSRVSFKLVGEGDELKILAEALTGVVKFT